MCQEAWRHLQFVSAELYSTEEIACLLTPSISPEHYGPRRPRLHRGQLYPQVEILKTKY